MFLVCSKHAQGVKPRLARRVNLARRACAVGPSARRRPVEGDARRQHPRNGAFGGGELRCGGQHQGPDGDRAEHDRENRQDEVLRADPRFLSSTRAR